MSIYKPKNNTWKNNKKKYFIIRNKKNFFFNNTNKTESPYKNSDKATKQLGRLLVMYGSIFFIFCFILGIGFIAWLSKGLPNPNQLIEREIAQSTKIYDRTGETILYEIHGEEKRTLVSLDDIPDFLEKATISVEDKDFYKHRGFSLWAIFRTVITNVFYGKKAGGSTLTQQFVKNSVLTTEKTYTRKIKELILAYKIEKKFNKNEILQMYLNEIPYGSTSYGVEAASQRYFGKSVKNINLAEAAILAALPQAPSRYSPYGSNLDLLIGRQEHILNLMVEYGYISKEEAEEAKNYQLDFKEQDENIKAPHFVMYIKEILAEKYGEKLIEQGGLKIITSLDLYKQEIAEEIISEMSEKNEKNYNASNAALVSIDPKTGEILTMVGSKDYFNDEIDGQVNIALAKRQPGSSLKPLVYASSFTKGYNPNTILYDVVTNFSADPGKKYEPRNYDNQEHGPISMRKALAGSLNTPAVKAIYLAGLDTVADFAKELGYSTLQDKDRFGLSLVLGGAEVKLLEHTNAYGAFARDGVIHKIKPILKIEDSSGKIVEEIQTDEGKQVFEQNITRMINDILSDNSARAFVFGEKNWLTLGNRPVAAKTGTTNDYRDAWTIGYTPSLITGVWVGNNDNSEMKRGADGSNVAAPIWHDYMKKVLGDTPIEEFKKPIIKETGKDVIDGKESLEKIIKIDKISGLLASENTPPEYIEEKKFIEPHCILYYVDKNDPLGKKPENPENDPQFKLWEEAVQNWAKAQNFATSTPPLEVDNVHTKENQPTLTILSPANNEVITSPLLISRIETQAPRGISRSEYYINNNLLSTNRFFPYNLEKKIQFLKNGFYSLKVKVCDDVENCTSQEVEFNLILENNEKNINITQQITTPSNGLALSNIDFPLPIGLVVNEPDIIAKIELYYKNSENKNPVLIKKIQEITAKDININWENIPETDTYKIYSEATLWTGEIIPSNEVTLIINNIIPVIPETKE